MTSLHDLFRNPAPATILSAAVLMLSMSLGHAQEGAAPGASGAGMPQMGGKQQEFMQARAEMQQLQQQLGEIQKQALEADPALEDQQQAFRDLIVSTMQDNGHTPEEDINRLQELQTEIQNQDLPDEQRQKLIQEFQQTNQGLQQAQQQAMQDTTVQEAQETLNDALMTAMVEADPNTQKIISQLRQTQQKLIQIQQEVMSSQGQQQPRPAPAP